MTKILPSESTSPCVYKANVPRISFDSFQEMTRRKRNDHWLNTQLWKLPIWRMDRPNPGTRRNRFVALHSPHPQAHAGISSRAHFYHKRGSALALSDPVPIES